MFSFLRLGPCGQFLFVVFVSSCASFRHENKTDFFLKTAEMIFPATSLVTQCNNASIIVKETLTFSCYEARVSLHYQVPKCRACVYDQAEIFTILYRLSNLQMFIDEQY